MAERREAGSRITDARLALGALLAAAGLSLAGCSQSEARAQDAPKSEIQLASAEEATQFAQLSDTVKAEIRQNFKDCMADVALDVAEEDSQAGKDYAYDSGLEDCDGIRTNEIRSAVARQNIEETTRRITSG